VALGHYSGRSVATGRDLDVPFVHILRFRDAKVAEMRISADTHRWMEIVGDTDTPATTTA
jgi:ketosteroid isomerase-like protein